MEKITPFSFHEKVEIVLLYPDHLYLMVAISDLFNVTGFETFSLLRVFIETIPG